MNSLRKLSIGEVIVCKPMAGMFSVVLENLDRYTLAMPTDKENLWNVYRSTIFANGDRVYYFKGGIPGQSYDFGIITDIGTFAYSKLVQIRFDGSDTLTERSVLHLKHEYL